MKTSTFLALVVSAVAITAVNGGSFLRPRGADEVWGGVNITASVLEVYNSISAPTCNVTDYCVQLRTAVVPRCLSLQGSAGCWCTLHDPIHYCAICMSSPTDNTTNPEQTQAATEGHANYHKGCAAWQAYLNASAAGSLTTSVPPTTSAPLPTLTPTADAATSSSSSKSSVSGGAIAGIVIGGIAFLAVVISITYLVSRCLTNQAAQQARQSTYAGEKSMHMGSPSTIPGYFGGMDGPGNKSGPNTPPPQQLPYQGQPMIAPGPYPNQSIPPQSGYPAGALFPGGRPDSMVSEAQSQSTQGAQYQPMRQGSDFGAPGVQQPLQPQPRQPVQPQPPLGQYQNSNHRGSRSNIVSPPPPFSANPQG